MLGPSEECHLVVCGLRAFAEDVSLPICLGSPDADAVEVMGKS